MDTSNNAITETDCNLALEILTEGRLTNQSETHEGECLAQEFRNFRDRHIELVSGRNVVGLGIGEKATLGKLTKHMALRFYVQKKIQKERCAPAILIPKVLDVPTIGEVTTDVVEIGHSAPRSQHYSVNNGVHPGCSIGVGLARGTLGCFVRKRNGNEIHLLSSAHIIARDGIAPMHTHIFQPAPIDSPVHHSTPIAYLSDCLPFEFSELYFRNLADAAIARTNLPVQPENLIPGIGKPLGLVDPVRGMRVKKCGRSTGVTRGVVRDVNFMTRLIYEKDGMGNVGSVGFKDQILVSNFSDDGDSGSLVLTDDNIGVGLLMAGSGSVSICNKIRNVFELLDIELV